MKKIIAGLLALLGISLPDPGADEDLADASADLRSMVLNLTPEEVGISRDTSSDKVYAVIMETGYPEGSFTLSSIVGGQASLYFSAGGGILGGGRHESVQEASNKVLSVAQKYYKKATQVETHPLPAEGEVLFYFLTFDGVLSYGAKEDDLGNERDVLSGLFFAGHELITELRLITENE